MVSKSLSPEAKQAIAVEWFHQSLIAHSFRDLEKALPVVASVNKMQVKEFVQSLTDEGLIRVEKIGGGNWYWSFVSDTKKIKEKELLDFTTEHEKLKNSIADVDVQIQDEAAARDGAEVLEDGGIDRKTLLDAQKRLQKEIAVLAIDLAGYSHDDPAEVLRKAEETRSMKANVEKWTDYIQCVEGLLKRMTGDRATTAQLMENICGGEYVVGEGLKDL